MPRKTLEYIGKPGLRYRTRRLLPGDMITCSEPEAKVWLRSKRFKKARPIGTLPPPPADVLAKFDHDGNGLPGGSKAPTPSDDLVQLRADYTEKLGKRPFPGWDADELRRRMAEAENG